MFIIAVILRTTLPNSLLQISCKGGEREAAAAERRKERRSDTENHRQSEMNVAEDRLVHREIRDDGDTILRRVV
jgi:hypothetical protein